MNAMKWIYYILCCVGIVGVFTSCYDEKALPPTEDGEGMSRYEFPQGTNSWDKDIEEIAEEFNVYLIYKNFKPADFNRSWTGVAGSDYKAQDLTDEQAEFATNFMKNHIFAYLNKEVTKKVLPMYYYMASDYHYVWRLDLGFMVMEQKVMMPDVFDGMDFWAICLFADDDSEMDVSEIIEAPVTKEDYYYRRRGILLHILRTAYEKRNIEIPAGFENGFDYQSDVKYEYGQEGDKDYYVRRGFPGISNGDDLNSVKNIGEMNNEKNFQAYIHLCAYYTAEALEEMWPQAEYPFLWEKRSFILNYMKTKYNLDLEAMAEGPEI